MVDYPVYKPKFKYTITTLELTEDEQGNPIYNETLSHAFYGDSVEQIQAIIRAHSQTDTFFAGSMIGKWNNIVLKNEYRDLELNKI